MLALIAGRGQLPGHIVAAHGAPVLVAALEGFAPDHLTPDITFRVERLGSFIADLKARGVTQICMAGAIGRPALDPAMIDAATMPLVPRMMQALGQGDDASAMRALTAFGRLLRLDASLPRGMRVGMGTDARVRGAVAALLRGQGERVGLKKEAIGLLPFILAPGVGGGGADDEE